MLSNILVLINTSMFGASGHSPKACSTPNKKTPAHRKMSRGLMMVQLLKPWSPSTEQSRAAQSLKPSALHLANHRLHHLHHRLVLPRIQRIGVRRAKATSVIVKVLAARVGELVCQRSAAEDVSADADV